MGYFKDQAIRDMDRGYEEDNYTSYRTRSPWAPRFNPDAGIPKEKETQVTSRPIGMVAIYVVRGSQPGTAYDVEVDPHGNWFCSCPSYIHRGQYLPIPACKHTVAKQAELLAAQVAVAVKAPSPVGSKSRLEVMYSAYLPE